jgi:hypothetical protein
VDSVVFTERVPIFLCNPAIFGCYLGPWSTIPRNTLFLNNPAIVSASGLTQLSGGPSISIIFPDSLLSKMQDTSEDDFYDWPINSKSDFISIIDKYNAVLREISLQIHGYRELGFHEYQSAKLLCDFLEKEGFTVERGIAGDETAFVATFGQGKNGPRVSFNAVLLSTIVEIDGRNTMHFLKLATLVVIISLQFARLVQLWPRKHGWRRTARA